MLKLIKKIYEVDDKYWWKTLGLVVMIFIVVQIFK